MMHYNYREAMVSDILDYIRDEITLTDYETRDNLHEYLYDALFVHDSVTGNASGSYTFNRYTAKEYVLDNVDDLQAACAEFCVEPSEIGEHFLREDWEWMDVTIRCHLLGEMIGAALDALEDSDNIEIPWIKEA